jgi:hypothetical protein
MGVLKSVWIPSENILWRCVILSKDIKIGDLRTYGWENILKIIVSKLGNPTLTIKKKNWMNIYDKTQVS